MARKHIEPFVDRDVAFKKMTLPGFGKGMSYKMLSIDEDTGACTMTVKFDSGYRMPPSMSYTEWEMQILSGSIKYGDDVHTAGYYFPCAGRRTSACHARAARRDRTAHVQLC